MTIYERLQQATDVRVGFSRSDGFISKVIRWFTRGKVSHALLTFSLPGLPVREVLEADWPGVQIRPFKAGELCAEYRPPAGVDLKHGLLEASKQLGAMYDYAGLGGMGPVEVARRIGWEIRNPTQSFKAWFCSELACFAMQRAKWPGVEGLENGSTDPEQLRKVCEARHG